MRLPYFFFLLSGNGGEVRDKLDLAPKVRQRFICQTVLDRPAKHCSVLSLVGHGRWGLWRA